MISLYRPPPTVKPGHASRASFSDDGVRRLGCGDRVRVPVHERPGVTFAAIDAGDPQVERRYFGASSDLGLPVFYVLEAGEIGSDVAGEGIKSGDAPVFEACSG
jgi:hypothetical protein